MKKNENLLASTVSLLQPGQDRRGNILKRIELNQGF